MPGDPPDVRRAPVHVVGLVVEHHFEGGGGVEHVAADGVENSLQARRQERGACEQAQRDQNRKSSNDPTVIPLPVTPNMSCSVGTTRFQQILVVKCVEEAAGGGGWR